MAAGPLGSKLDTVPSLLSWFPLIEPTVLAALSHPTLPVSVMSKCVENVSRTLRRSLSVTYFDEL